MKNKRPIQEGAIKNDVRYIYIFIYIYITKHTYMT